MTFEGIEETFPEAWFWSCDNACMLSVFAVGAIWFQLARVYHCMSGAVVLSHSMLWEELQQQTLSINNSGEHPNANHSHSLEDIEATKPKCIETHCCLKVVWECCGVSMRNVTCQGGYYVNTSSGLLFLDELTWDKMFNGLRQQYECAYVILLGIVCLLVSSEAATLILDSCLLSFILWSTSIGVFWTSIYCWIKFGLLSISWWLPVSYLDAIARLE